MKIITQFKTCRKGLHQYPAEKRRCPGCQKESRRRREEANPERKRELERKWCKENPERKRESRRKWCEANPEQNQKLKRKWYEANLEKHREWGRLWVAANPGKANANTAKHRAAKRQAIASWADHNKIKEIYKECARLTKKTGVKHQVDHIYPLQNKYMCGLHVENNLQILSAAENASKSNKFWPGQLDCQKP